MLVTHILHLTYLSLLFIPCKMVEVAPEIPVNPMLSIYCCIQHKVIEA